MNVSLLYDKSVTNLSNLAPMSLISPPTFNIRFIPSAFPEHSLDISSRSGIPNSCMLLFTLVIATVSPVFDDSADCEVAIS